MSYDTDVMAPRESAIQDMVRKVEALREQQRKRYPGRFLTVQIRPSPDDDPQIFAEAMRRIEGEPRIQQMTQEILGLLRPGEDRGSLLEAMRRAGEQLQR